MTLSTINMPDPNEPPPLKEPVKTPDKEPTAPGDDTAPTKPK